MVELSSLGNKLYLKEFLTSKNTMETFCREYNTLLGCISEVLQSTSMKCSEEYEKQYFSLEHVRTVSRATELICRHDNISNLRRNLDCILDPAVQREVNKCNSRRHPMNCFSKEATDCGKHTFTSRCGIEAADISAHTEDVFYCYKGKTPSLLKLFN
jgi:hypothetical protein